MIHKLDEQTLDFGTGLILACIARKPVRDIPGLKLYDPYGRTLLAFERTLQVEGGGLGAFRQPWLSIHSEDEP